MQERNRRTQDERRAETRRQLLAAARRLFADKGYAATSTPEIATDAGLTRGALYHHYADKLALFAAVVEREHEALAAAIDAATASDAASPVDMLIDGGDAFLDAMQDPGRRRILLVDAPAALGRPALDAIEARHGLTTLVAGIEAARAAGAIRDVPALPLAHLLNAMFDRAALAEPDELPAYRTAIHTLIRGLEA